MKYNLNKIKWKVIVSVVKLNGQICCPSQFDIIVTSHSCEVAPLSFKHSLTVR